MAVYVDEMFATARSAQWPYDSACHMYADSLDELKAMARRLRLKDEYIQHGTLTHYDLTKGKRGQALNYGAIPHTQRQTVNFIRAQRGQEPLTA